jgi:hypothetical protein
MPTSEGKSVFSTNNSRAAGGEMRDVSTIDCYPMVVRPLRALRRG